MPNSLSSGTLSETPGIDVTLDNGIGRIRLNRPTVRNAISQAMWQALPAICAGLSGARVVIVSGAGGAFSAGADISEFDTVYADEASIGAANAAIRAGQQALADMECPVIAAIDGACIGGGCGLALHADIRFASASARFAITPANLGLAYSYEDTARLVQVVGPSAAKDILFSARVLEADEALRIGLINHLVEVDQLEARVSAYAGEIASRSPVSQSISKATIDAIASGRGADDELRARTEASFLGPDFQEGVAAFKAKRKPDFS